MRGLLLLLPLLLGSCVTFAWTRDRHHEPVPRAAIQSLEPARTTLADALAALGAPLFAWEYRGSGAALAWGWTDADHKGFSVGYQFQDTGSVSMSYDDTGSKLRGVVLFFDADLVLERVREGWLRDLEREARRRPAPVEEDSGPR